MLVSIMSFVQSELLPYDAVVRNIDVNLVSFKEEQRPYRIDAASHVGAAVLFHVARSG